MKTVQRSFPLLAGSRRATRQERTGYGVCELLPTNNRHQRRYSLIDEPHTASSGDDGAENFLIKRRQNRSTSGGIGGLGKASTTWQWVHMREGACCQGGGIGGVCESIRSVSGSKLTIEWFNLVGFKRKLNLKPWTLLCMTQDDRKS